MSAPLWELLEGLEDAVAELLALVRCEDPNAPSDPEPTEAHRQVWDVSRRLARELEADSHVVRSGLDVTPLVAWRRLKHPGNDREVGSLLALREWVVQAKMGIDQRVSLRPQNPKELLKHLHEQLGWLEDAKAEDDVRGAWLRLHDVGWNTALYCTRRGWDTLAAPIDDLVAYLAPSDEYAPSLANVPHTLITRARLAAIRVGNKLQIEGAVQQAPAPAPPSGEPTEQPAGASAPSVGGSRIDTEEQLAGEMSRRRWHQSARLVRHMINRDSATFLEIAEQVYGDGFTKHGTIKNLSSRTNGLCEDLRVRWRYRINNETIEKIPPTLLP